MILAPGKLEPRRRCQHCERDIFPAANGYWQDRDGFLVCVKYTGELSSAPLNYIHHTPLPEIK